MKPQELKLLIDEGEEMPSGDCDSVSQLIARWVFESLKKSTMDDDSIRSNDPSGIE